MKLLKCVSVITVLFFLVLSSSLVMAQKSPAKSPAMSADEIKVKQKLEQKLPGIPIDRVTKTKLMGGLYEVLVGGQLVYTNKTASHVFTGAILDISRAPAERINITEKRLAEIFRVDVATLPLDAAFKRVKGDGSRVIYLFSDIDCPFCARIEQTLAEMDNLTIYTFLYPLEGLHPDALNKSKRIWCAPDRAKAWETYFDTKTLPDNAGDCVAPFETVQQLAERYNIRGTPGIVFQNGQTVSGALPKERLEEALRIVAQSLK